MKLFQGQSGTALQLPGQGRVGHQPPSGHHMLDGGEGGGKVPAVLGGVQIAVVAQGHPGLLHGVAEGLHANLAFVKIFADSGVNGQLVDGVAVINAQNGRPLLGGLCSHPGFDGDLDVQLGGKDLVKEAVHLLGLGQETGASLLGKDRARGTAQVQVDLLIAHILKESGGWEKGLSLVGEKLGDHRDALVVFREHIRQAPSGQRRIHRRGPEGGIIGVYPGKHLVVEGPKGPVGDALQGGVGNGHRYLLHEVA